MEAAWLVVRKLHLWFYSFGIKCDVEVDVSACVLSASGVMWVAVDACCTDLGSCRRVSGVMGEAVVM